MAMTGTIYLTGASVAIVGGIYWNKASTIGAIAALLGGLVSLSGLFLQPIQEVLPWLSFGMLGLANFFICAVLLVVFSLLYPDRGSRQVGTRISSKPEA